ncbi:DUF4244 domain-containing protein [Yinghuangia seranimata]|uniref:DUF4244 domain-containing protein n=1 Tax=Yinghuangia seranimata TaxID=408067 RepID=UPI00248C0DEC|nr:DUF4244 domain-containing protein [Yinghuangia seranimata]MDI2127924.1 DUF4244 domain-containing protein [Yinghuangia seranimata]
MSANPTAPPAIRQRIGRRAHVVLVRLGRASRDESGMSTAEYAVGTVAAVAFGGVLYKVVTSDSVMTALSGIIGKALNASF